MRINEFRKISTIDYPGKLACIIFTPGCNFRCPSCHGRHVVYGESRYTKEDVFSYIDFAKGFVDGVVISGGEPTIQLGLEDFCRDVKRKLGKDFGIKLDTNGSNPEVLENLLKEKLVDYLALDVKGTKELYAELTGRNIDLEQIGESFRIARKFPGYEFRTTIVPVYDNGFRWFNDEEVKEMVEWIRGYGNGRWYLQPFVARSREENAMMDDMFTKEELTYRNMCMTPQDVLERMQKIIGEDFDCRIR